MTKSLRVRLFLSYLAVTSIILLSAGLTLGLVWHSAQERIMRARLSETLPLAARLVRANLRQGIPPEQITRKINKEILPRQFRLLLVQQGKIIGDTANGALVGQTLPENLPDKLKRSGKHILTGTFSSLRGGQYFYALTVVPLRPEDNNLKSALWVVQIAPRRLFSLNDELTGPLVWSLLAALLTGLIFSWMVSRWITRPLTQIASAADEIAQGNLDMELQVSGPSEVQRVARQFNNMTAEVRASRQAQREFIANVSHDLKTPLTAIQGFSQALVEGVASDIQGVQRAAGIIHDESLRMGRLVDQLLDLARLDAGQVQIRQERVDVSALLVDTIRRFRPVAQAKAINLQMDVASDLQLLGDTDRLMQVFTNLLDNALRHTPSQGTIHCRVQPSGSAADFIEVTISDTGPGIPPEDLPHVFDRFYQAEKARRRGNSGLGLAIVQEIVRAHRGHVQVSSPPGQGATFTILFPSS
jgi:signal transduction histidine kinase